MTDPDGFTKCGQSRELVVLLHAWTATPANLDGVVQATRSALPDADTWVPALPIQRPLTRSRAQDMALAILAGIDRLTAGHPGYERITLVGHSYGAVLARAVWAAAMGGQEDGTALPGLARAWGPKVGRLVLLAALARGWNALAPLSTSVRVALWAGELVERVTGPGYAILDIRRGAPFITLVRLQTLAVIQALRHRGATPPVTVQLLGTVDDVVAPGDNVDLAAGANFYYVEVPRTGHPDIVDFGGTAGRARHDLYLAALTGSPDRLQAIAVTPAAVADMVNDAPDNYGGDGDADGSEAPSVLRTHPEVRDVVFVVHGIRDYGYWTRKLAVRIRVRAPDRGRWCRTVTSTYGFFPMGPFMLRAERRKRAGWLMDQYVAARARYPGAAFHCIGHSNGTYLIAAALVLCRAIRFGNVVFAGSVVRPDYGWQERMAAGQVRRVLNYVATRDIVVASVPSAVQPWRFADLGGAGHRGFPEQPNVRNIEWVPGGHSAALRSQHWDEIADFVLGGAFPEQRLPPAPDAGERPDDARRGAAQARWVAAVGRSPLLYISAGLALIVAALGWVVSRSFAVGPVLGSAVVLFIAALCARILTRL